MLPVFIKRQHLNWNVPGCRILLQVVKNGSSPACQAEKRRATQRSRMTYSLGQHKRFRTARGHTDFESLVPREITQHPRVMCIVLDNHEDRIVRLQIVAFVGNLLDHMFRHSCRRYLRRPDGRSESLFSAIVGRSCTRRRTHIGLRQVERERASAARGAPKLNFSSKQAGQFAADRQAQSGSAVLAAGAGICLLKRLKNDSLLLSWNAECRC